MSASKKIYKINLNLSPEQFKAIGQVAAYWSLLEHLLGQAIADVLAISKKAGRVLTTQMNIRPKMEVLQLLARLKPLSDEDQAELIDIIKQINEAAEWRRLIVHGIWAKDDDGKYYILKYWGGKGGSKRIDGASYPADAQSLQEVADHIAILAHAFDEWWGHRRKLLLASQHKPS